MGTCLALGPTLLSTLTARADGLVASTWSQEALEGVAQSLESPELRMLRLAEEELFGGGPEELEAPYDPDCIYGVPDALTSDAPPAKLERAGQVVDVSFLSELKLPSLPVRWDSRVIEYLLFFKHDRRGRELAAAWLKRMERHGALIRRVLAEHSLPQDLQYVAMIESGYDLLAHSNQDAWGMWQFVKQPAEHYGLRVDKWADERLDPERSTRAAALYLRDLYDRFGTWELAFAAYNMGYGALLRAIKKYNTNDYWLLSHLEAGLPFETTLYVAKITAMAVVANNPDRFGFGGLSMEPRVELEKVQVAEGTPLRPIAAAAGMDVEALKALNPHLLRGKVPPGEPRVNVYVPRASYEQFAKRWSKNHEPRLHVGYTVRFGETLEDVARRFGISGPKLRELNHLASDEGVQAGQALLVPATAEVKTLGSEKLVATVPAKSVKMPGRKQIFYRVGSKDTPAAVARFFDVTVDELVAWNNLTESGALQRDMLLQLFVSPDLDLSRAVVFTPDQVHVLTVGTDEFFDFHEGQRGRVRVRYRVQPNDTLEKIAERFELSAGSIGRINQFASNKQLKADDWVIVYVPEQQLAELEKKGVIAAIGARTPAEVAQASTSEGTKEVGAPAEELAAETDPEEASDEPLPPPVSPADLAPAASPAVPPEAEHTQGAAGKTGSRAAP